MSEHVASEITAGDSPPRWRRVAERYADSLPLICFLLTSRVSDVADVRWPAAFRVAGIVAAVILTWRLWRPGWASSLLVGINLYLFVGGIGIWLSIDAIRIPYTLSMASGMYLFVACVAAGGTLCLRCGFLGMGTIGDPRLRRINWEWFVLALIGAGLAWILRGNEVLAGVPPFFLLYLGEHLQRARLNRSVEHVSHQCYSGDQERALADDADDPTDPTIITDAQPAELLPHGDDFRFLDEVGPIEPRRSGKGRWRPRGDETYLRSHFPDRPIVPGALIIEAMAQLCGVVLFWQDRGRTASIAHVDVRLKRPVVPPADILLQTTLIRELGALAVFDVTAEHEGHTVAIGTVTLAALAAPAPDSTGSDSTNVESTDEP